MDLALQERLLGKAKRPDHYLERLSFGGIDNSPRGRISKLYREWCF